MKTRILSIIISVSTLLSCHHIDKWDNDPVGNFEALWTIVDQHYCFFAYKDVDWNDVYNRYRPHVSDKMNSRELFTLCAEMLAELRDGHTNLSSGFNTSYYTKWWSDYPQNYDERLVRQYYFNFGEQRLGTVSYAMLPQNIGYLHYGSFVTGLGHGNIDAILNTFILANGLIIDVRDNGGGSIDNVETLVSHFINDRILAGYMSHKTGPGHNDFSEPRAYYFDPVKAPNMRWQKPVIILTNRSTYSSANNFVSIMKHLPNVTIVGDTTGGGSGMPFSSELPCGWAVRFSACPIYDSRGQTTEFGVSPTPGCHIDLDPIAALSGHDTILDFAIDLLTR